MTVSVVALATAADTAILSWINGIVGIWPLGERAFYAWATNSLTKSAPLGVMFWLLWFLYDARRDRARLLGTLAVAVIAIFVGRVAALALPHRVRPMHQADSGWRLPDGVVPEPLEGWSSFPSDHAVLFFALAACFFWCDLGQAR